MAYDFEKYRDKREKVLGVKKRSISFGALAAFVSLAIVFGLSVVIIPRSIAFFQMRHLKDVIYKLPVESSLSEAGLAQLRQYEGVRNVAVDGQGSRIIITFNHSEVDPQKFSTFFHSQGVSAVLLNQVGHSERMQTLKKEAEFEAL
ncbi:MAG: hypothetical protein KQH63_02365 [Desulfobulbaceae bacterium]|nr:hypothetical protein [Desulfobulbaceae bacterium]